MTKVEISNKDNTYQSNTYYIEIEAIKIDYDYQSQIQTELYKPKAKSKWGTAAVTYFVDLQQKIKVITITGYIDRFSNRSSSWTANKVTDVAVVRQRLEYMWEYGGTIKFIIGRGDFYRNIADSGYRTGTFSGGSINAHVAEGMITKLNFVEGSDDHIDRGTPGVAPDSENYPNAVKERVDKYLVTISIKEGTIR